MRKRPSGTTRTVRTPENVESIRKAVLSIPNRSAWKQSSELSLSNRLVRRILHLDLQFQPYKLFVLQQLNPRDYAQRLNFAHEMEVIFL
ncbi:hypothetical protein AVEN_152924-1 [Araneus ventricosus]|uniref:DUF4817 domain-containing protein n=1 Tax=Araneus ventricosus TaxID=182803 RepID=A0A4Y2AEQ4_ARAVE|nr:hypothetical protein AVEN_152924-1 [Araneus ventricosus]